MSDQPIDQPPIDQPPIDEVRAGDELDWAALERHLRANVAQRTLPDVPLRARQFTAGRANLTYLVSFGDEHLVVRRPPQGVLAPGAHDMAREARVLTHLGDAYPRAPRALHFCDDTSVIGAPFIVIEYREGVTVRDDIPAELAHHDDAARRVDLALVDAAADLHAVDPAAVGLDTLGHPDGFAERQVRGWADRWSRVSDDVAGPTMDEVARRLEAGLPRPQRASIIHNDLKLDNCQFHVDDPDTVTSVFDWDMATLGDPLFDIALMVSSMRSQPAWVIGDDEVAAHYSRRTGIDASGLGWYLAFATWRTAIVVQQLYRRFAAGDSADARLGGMGRMVPEMARRALALLDPGS